MHPVAPFLAAAIMAATPSAVRAQTDEQQPLTNAEMISASTGLVIGAASACPEVSRERVSAIMDKAAQAVAAAATDEDELTSAHDLFRENAETGRNQVNAGDVDCDQVNVAVAELERGL
jgi:hypothetical protein